MAHYSYMHEDSPPPFIVFRKSAPPVRSEPYDRALALVGIVHRIVSNAATRFYLKDKLDRAVTALVFQLGRVRAEIPSHRWRGYRSAQAHAADVMTILDIIAAQQAAPGEDVESARTLLRELIDDVAPRCNG